jgi:hypothetical protein
MKRTASALLVTASTVAASAQQAPQDLLAALHHRARPLLIFAAPGDARADDQYMAVQQHTDASKERQVHVILVSNAPVSQVYDAGPGPATSVATPTEQDALRKRFHVASGTFAVILVGKDGGEKLRATEPIPWEALKSTIDSMPMRQQEMRKPAQ